VHRDKLKVDYKVRERAKLEAARARRESLAASPYNEAVRRIERLTGKPRKEWEWKMNHPYSILATRAAKVLAGLEKIAA
jgi:hypothetical protein